jgi:amino acid transporter
LGLWLGPIGALNFIGVLVAIGIIVIYILANLSLIPLFWKRYPEEWKILPHLVVPILAVGLLVLAFYYTVWPIPPRPLSVAEAFVAVWLLVGAGLAIFLRGRIRDALERAVSMVYQAGENTVLAGVSDIQPRVLVTPAPMSDTNVSNT